MAVAILFALFAIQSRGTGQIAKASGPIMLLWFAAIGALGIVGVARHPAVIAAVDPRYGIALLTGHGWRGIALLGGVFLAMTGGEAMYADMGHIGRNPIRTSWYGIVLPALLLNYSTTMLLTTALLYNVMRARWGWPVGAALTVSGLFLTVELRSLRPICSKSVEEKLDPAYVWHQR